MLNPLRRLWPVLLSGLGIILAACASPGLDGAAGAPSPTGPAGMNRVPTASSQGTPTAQAGNGSPPMTAMAGNRTAAPDAGPKEALLTALRETQKLYGDIDAEYGERSKDKAVERWDGFYKTWAKTRKDLLDRYKLGDFPSENDKFYQEKIGLRLALFGLEDLGVCYDSKLHGKSPPDGKKVEDAQAQVEMGLARVADGLKS